MAGLARARTDASALCDPGWVARTWPGDWDERRAGQGCAKCAEGRPDEDQWGVRFFAGPWADAYLQRCPPQPATSVVVFRGRHVPDPCDFTDEELAGYGVTCVPSPKP